ncbi:DUF2905 domain-containing protein [Cloacibacillus evryensis]|uniref:DUF2905 domain-containing protein n=1 Tax=Cloacibacillus evryensis TaxID=508460 RepID=A0AAW5K435_9BACT|nr:DUF2905 domain-containing protein [Cloacibacillus evryensis]EHL65744.1 hypothetical protein HMPREF1006_00218 [Synergistes sp. 3_1_syn1]MCQ4815585.1 DUF2905 domain-containing protein [Cloacibacillus evryensis]
MNQLGKMLIAMGLLIAAIGFLLIIAGKLNIPFGKLPGDITYQKKNLTVFAPFGTMIVVSVILTLILNIFSRWK